MNKPLIFFFLFLSLSFSKPLEWTIQRSVVLEKDQVVSAKVSGAGIQKNLSIRWTLYKKDGLVILLKYDSIPYQFILYKDYQRNRYLFDLDGQDHIKKGNLMIVFEDFKDKKATLKLLVSGDISLMFN